MAEEHKHEHKTHEEHKPEHKANEKIWRYSTVALMVVIVLLVAAFLWKPGEANSTGAISVGSQNQIANKTVSFINTNVISGGGNATVDAVSLVSGMVNVTVLYQGRQIPVYATEDGKYLILPGAGVIDMDEPLPAAQEPTQQQPQQIPKSDKPTVQLFVMAFCPYGMQAETVMKPVFDLLGSKADIQIRFIATVSGTTADSVQSLHGAPEAQEDLRQVCIMKYYDQKTFWNYVTTINANCSSSYRDSAVYDPCWKNAATKAGIDSSKIDTCSKGAEGLALLKADADLSSSKGVSGSPTLIINGVTFSGARTPDGYKQGICNAFTTSPSECSQNLSTTGSAASGDCG
jgi:protein-disulfide isomerase